MDVMTDSSTTSKLLLMFALSTILEKNEMLELSDSLPVEYGCLHRKGLYQSFPKRFRDTLLLTNEDPNENVTLNTAIPDQLGHLSHSAIVYSANSNSKRDFSSTLKSIFYKKGVHQLYKLQDSFWNRCKSLLKHELTTAIKYLTDCVMSYDMFNVLSVSVFGSLSLFLYSRINNYRIQKYFKYYLIGASSISSLILLMKSAENSSLFSVSESSCELNTTFTNSATVYYKVPCLKSMYKSISVLLSKYCDGISHSIESLGALHQIFAIGTFVTVYFSMKYKSTINAWQWLRDVIVYRLIVLYLDSELCQKDNMPKR